MEESFILAHDFRGLSPGSVGQGRNSTEEGEGIIEQSCSTWQRRKEGKRRGKEHTVQVTALTHLL